MWSFASNDFRVMLSQHLLSLLLHMCWLLQGEKLRREKQLVKDIAEFLLLSQIPGFVST